MLLSPIKKLEPFLGLFWFLSGDVLQIVLKYDVLYVVVIFYDNITLELCWIFDSTTSDYLSCKRDMELIIFC